MPANEVRPVGFRFLVFAFFACLHVSPNQFVLWFRSDARHIETVTPTNSSWRTIMRTATAVVVGLFLVTVASASASASSVLAAGDNAPADPVLVGAIRWDAYWSKPGQPDFDDPNYGIVTRTTTFDMSTKEWHYRVPFFGEEINDTAITCDGDSADVMEQELEFVCVRCDTVGT